MGIAGALGLFASIIIHELSHSLVARRYGMQMRGITLFIFGGVAEMTDEPPSAKAEFFMAIAGPIVSVIVSAFCGGLWFIGFAFQLPSSLLGVIGYLGLINTALAIFNLIPGFPLDGGRVLRSFLWYLKDDLLWATKIASHLGVAFGTLLFVVGIYYLISGIVFGGVWWIMIGMFLRSAAQRSYQQQVMRKTLWGQRVFQVMNPNPVTVPPIISIEELVEHYIYQHHYKMFPVVEDARLLGCVTIEQVKHVPRDEWNRQTVRTITQQCQPENTVHPNQDAMSAMTVMLKTGKSRMLVADGDHLIGILALRDMLDLISLKTELDNRVR